MKEGIYPRDSVKPNRMWLTGYNFGESLFKSMEAAGLHYADGKWSPKQRGLRKSALSVAKQVDGHPIEDARSHR